MSSVSWILSEIESMRTSRCRGVASRPVRAREIHRIFRHRPARPGLGAAPRSATPARTAAISDITIRQIVEDMPFLYFAPAMQKLKSPVWLVDHQRLF
jgi:hypothetical protein